MSVEIFRPRPDDGTDPPRPNPFPSGCVEVDPDPHSPNEYFGGSLKTWTLDSCSHVVAGIVVRPETHITGEPGEDEPGDTAIASAHGVRAMNIAAENDEEPCMRHYGRVTLGHDGDARAVFCSNHAGGSAQETHEGLLFLARQTRSQIFAGQPKFLETGDAAILTAIATPDWQEVHLVTHAQRCWGPQF